VSLHAFSTCPEDLDRLFGRGRFDADEAQPTNERIIRFDVVAVLRRGRAPDEGDLTAPDRLLELLVPSI